MINATRPNQTFRRKLRTFRRSGAKTAGVASSVTADLSSAGTPNPFGNSAEFTEVDYVDQLNHVLPPSFGVVNFFPPPNDVAANGLTIELWFKAESSGILVGLPMDTTSFAQGVAPLLYIDSNGLLRGGLFDSTQITLLSPPQNLITSQASNGLIVVGPLNALASPLSVVDGQWHHAALVAQPGNNALQSLFLDGRLAASGQANGSLGFSFVASNGTSWQQQTNAPIPFGGSITPQPQTLPSPNFLPYAQGFTGCLNELRSWNVPRTVTQIQQLMLQPLGSDWTSYQEQGLFGYVGSSLMPKVINPGPYQSLTSDAPPFDPFTDVDNRIPGYQNFGIFTAIPFSAVALEVKFQPSQEYSTKISLWQGDQLQVTFPKQDAHGDNLSATFSMTLTNGVSGEVQTIAQIAPGSDVTITAPLTGCYRLDFTYATASDPVTIDNLQFMLVPGPSNTLMQLLLDVVPSQTAYTDPNYPITETIVADPRHPGQTVTLDPYWPLFTDESVFLIDQNSTYSADDLLSAYLDFNETARGVAKSGGSTFYDFFNLAANSATISDPGDLFKLLDGAYREMTNNKMPPVPSPPFSSAVDQVYAFIYDVNSMRNTLYEFLKAYQGWAQSAINDLNLSDIPSTIANQIYNDQEKLQVKLKGPSTFHFILNLLVGSALVGLGAVAAPLLGVAAGTAVAVGFAAGAGANALSELFGTVMNSSRVKSQLDTVSYSALSDVAAKVSTDIANAYTTILTSLLDYAYLQTLYSNYGLLQALNFVSAQPLFDANSQAIQPGPGNSLTTGVTYASWQALIPSVFTWSPKLITEYIELGTYKTPEVFFPEKPVTLPSNSVPSQLGVFEILQGDPDVFYTMVAKVQEWQTATKSPSGQFFSVCPIFIQIDKTVYTAVWVITWTLTDTNHHAMSDDLAASLFGMGDPNVVLSLADQNNPLAAASYGWYCQIANAAVTTPFDAFMNWGEGVPSYSPQILVTQLPKQGKLYPATFGDPASFAAAAAADTPPPAIVTLEPAVLDLGAVTVGATNTQSALIANNQREALTSITVTNDYPGDFSVSGLPTDLPSGGSATIDVTFSPSEAGIQAGKITLSTKGLYGPVLLTLEFLGTGV